jgi:hypothetical protein
MAQPTTNDWRSILLASLLILLLVYTASSKLLDRYQFELTLSQMPYLSLGSIVLSWLVPLIEIYIALLLLMPATRQRGFSFSLLLLLAFTAYLGVVVWIAPHLPCSCGGVISWLGWRDHLFFNMVFLLIAFSGWRLEKARTLNHSQFGMQLNFYSNKPTAGGRQG